MTRTRHPFARSGGMVFPPADNPKEGGARVDFRPDVPFGNQIEWHGLRFGWSRVVICPCKGYNGQTDQLDPNCPWCNGLGWRPFKTPGYFIDYAKTGPLNDEQALLVERNKCMVIRGIVTSMAQQPNMFSVLGNWALGSVMITVRSANKLGYYDRLIYLDGVTTHCEIVEQGDSDTIKTRYPVAALNAVVSLEVEYGDEDLELVDGCATWKTGKRPAAGTRVSLSYLYHPVFVVIEFAHLLRIAPVRNLNVTAPDSPMGGNMELPIQVVARLEHLPLET